MNQHLTHTLIATAVASLFATPILASDFVINQDIAAGHTQQGASTDTIKTNNNNPAQHYTNAGTIQGYGILEIGDWRTLTNAEGGVIDVNHYTAEKDSSAAKLVNQGTVHVHESNFGVTLANAGTVLVNGDSLVLTNRNLIVKEGSVIKNAKTGERLKLIKVDHQRRVNSMTVEENGVLAADEIYINVNDQGFVLQGTLEGDKITVDGSYIRFAQTGLVTGRDVTLTQIDQVGEYGEVAERGGEIIATDKLTLTSFTRVEDLKITAPVIVAKTNAFCLQGNSTVSGLKHIELGSTMRLVGDDVKINDNDYIDEVVFLGKTNANNGARIQNERGKTLGIGKLVVNKTTNDKGQVVTSNLIDKSTSKTEGLTSFDIGVVDVAKDAKLTVYGDDKDGGAKTHLKLGQVNLDDGAELQLGWRDGGYVDFASKKVDFITLSTESKVTKGLSQTNEATIQNVVFTGSNASIDTRTVGDVTNVYLKAGNAGNTLANVASDKLNVMLERTDSGILSVKKTDDKTTVNVIAAPDNNSGEIEKDLHQIAEAVIFEDKKVHTVTQLADDMNDGASATVVDNKVSNVKVHTNANINGIAEMTALGLHIWRNEINDMNKRLGELRDSSDEANGVWARVYNGKAKFGNQKITNKYTAFQFGYDHQVVPGTWLGGALSWTDGNNDFAVGGGDSSLLAFTGYGSKLWDNGMFLDVTGKFGRMKNEFDISLASGKSSASYHTNAVSVSAEAGWRLYPMQNSFYVEPQVELMYGHVFSVDYATSTGVNVEQDAADTLIGRAGVVLGLKCPDNRGNAYLRASVLHDWKGDADFTFSKTAGTARTISEELGGTWFEYGIGANFNATKQVHLYADVEAANGGEVDTDYRVNFGMRYSW